VNQEQKWKLTFGI